MKLKLCILSFMLLMTSCLIGKSDIVVKVPSRINSQIVVTNVTVTGGQLVLTGEKLDSVKNLKIEGFDSWDFSIISQSANLLTLQANNNSGITLALVAGTIYNFLFATAYGATTVPVVYTIPSNSVTSSMIQNLAISQSKLATMGATANQVLQFNGTTWGPATLPTGLSYQGAWNANTNSPVLGNPDCTVGTNGEYYIISNAGTRACFQSSGFLV